MKEIVIFAGTTEGRRLSETLAAAGVRHTVCVATEYGEMVLKDHPLVTIHRGRMDQEEMARFIREKGACAVVDATHPYADLVTRNIRAALAGMDVPYLRLKREEGAADAEWDGVTYFDSHEACAKALEHMEGNILLTTGSKNLGIYCSQAGMKQRLYVRVLPGLESISLCMEQGICGRQILALQGPFSVELNAAIMMQYQIACVVTKKSGAAGGYGEKLEAARRTGASCFVILPENEEKDHWSFEEICGRLEQICGTKIQVSNQFDITLAGIGMGHENGLTSEVKEAIQSADILLGAQRMIAPYRPRVEKRAYYRSDQILPYLQELQKDGWSGMRKVVVLFSGDTGFFSGCQQLWEAMDRAVKAGELNASVKIMPGISSVSYLASCVGESYHDGAILSIHGKSVDNLAEKIRRESKTFLLMSGACDVRKLGKTLIEAGLEMCEIIAGYQLSYPEQEVKRLSPKACLDIEAEGLYTCLIKNPDAKPGKLVHGTEDAEFIREKVPMTKEEVREVSICKLQLHRQAVVYDVGSGTGSIAVEIAALSDSVQVYALERKPEAVSLIQKNMKKFGLSNITVVETQAPEGMEALPAPTHAFIGGSGGNMKEILRVLYEKNPTMRVVINAISMETICEIRQILDTFPAAREAVVQMQVSRAKKAGSYHLMQAENPVWICSFDFVPRGE